VAGVPTNADAMPTLADVAGAFGVKRLDTGAVVVAAGTAMTTDGTGSYSYQYTDAADGVEYAFVRRAVVKGRIIYNPGSMLVPPAIATRPTYVTLAEYATLAPMLPPLPVLTAASDSVRSACLAEASANIDSAMRYQGR
jgi:hypothetical protein